MSKTVWDKNLEAMEKWYPSFVELIREEKYVKDELEVMTETSWDGEKIFRIQKDGRKLYLGGKRNAKKPVQMWLERIGTLQKYTPVFLFGVGSGAYLKALVQNTETEVNIVVYEPSVTIFLTMLEEIDVSEELTDRPIAFVIEGLNGEEFMPIVNKVLVLENMKDIVEEVHPNYREFYADKLVEVIRPLQRKVQGVLINYNTGMLFAKDLAQNVFGNMKYVLDGYNTKKLSDVIPYSGAAILVAAGPSLNKNIQELKKAKNKAFILAVDTAIQPLIRAGIKPDAFLTLDPHKPLKLTGIKGAETIPVIAPTSARTEMLDQQTGKKIFYYDGYMLPAHVYRMSGKQFLTVASGGSVACSGFSLLYKMGFDTIILVGQDLAYTGNKSHADGTFEDKMKEENTRGMIMVKGNYEDKVPTILNLKLYMEWFRDYIAEVRKSYNIRVINATEGGAYIEGTELMTLKEAIEENCTQETDFEACIEEMESVFSEEERKKAVEYIHSVPAEYEEMAKIAKSLKKAYRRLDKIGRNGNMAHDGCVKQLNKIKKLTNRCHKMEGYQLVDTTIPAASFIIRSEYFDERESVEDEMVEIARQGIQYSDLLEKCAWLLKEMAENTLLPIE